MRVMGGAVSGGTAPTAFSWAMELTPLKARTRATTAMNVLWVLGPLLIAAWHVVTRRLSWRVEALGAAAFPLVAAAVARAFVPESPEFLAAARGAAAAASPGGHAGSWDTSTPTSPLPTPSRRPSRSKHHRARPSHARRHRASCGALVPLVLSWACVSASYCGLAYSAGALSKRVVLNFGC